MSDYRERFGRVGVETEVRHTDEHPDPTAQLQRYIDRACDPSNYEPNLALDLEIADLINQKKGSAPRQAAVAIVKNVNSRNPNVALLALALLDICVKNCGYPFHLQISTKDFLNELVRRFPDRPPPRPTRVHIRILEALEEWRQTICSTSRYKDDFGFIRDMHRLLSYKGYVFPEIRNDTAAVLNPSENIRTAEELEEEEKSARSAKLQELIRRGGPSDLLEANHLMKVMAGYDIESRTDYRAKAAEDVDKVRRKTLLLDEMLSRVSPGDTIGQLDVLDDLSTSMRNAQPKLQKLVEEERDDGAAITKILEVNDMINGVLERYHKIKHGDYGAKSTLSAGARSDPNTTRAANLIDFTGEIKDVESDRRATPTESSGDLLGDLEGLSFQSNSSSFGQGGSIALGFGSNTGMPGPPLLSSIQKANVASQSELTASPLHEPQSSPLRQSSRDQPLTVLSSDAMRVTLNTDRKPGELDINTIFENGANHAISDLKFQLAVPKLKMHPQSSRHLLPVAGQSVTQQIQIFGPQHATVKIKWKVTFFVHVSGDEDRQVEESGEAIL